MLMSQKFSLSFTHWLSSNQAAPLNRLKLIVCYRYADKRRCAAWSKSELSFYQQIGVEKEVEKSNKQVAILISVWSYIIFNHYHTLE